MSGHVGTAAGPLASRTWCGTALVSALGSVEAPSLLDAASHGPGCSYVTVVTPRASLASL